MPLRRTTSSDAGNVEPRAGVVRSDALRRFPFLVIGVHALLAALWMRKGLSDGADPPFPLWNNDLVQGGACLAIAVWLWLAMRRPASRAPGPRL